jgi:hypothetical protein
VTTQSLAQILESLSSFFSAGLASPTIARPLLFLVGHLASSLYLLEHAVWSYQKGASGQTESESQPDVEVFTRWVMNGSGELNGPGGWDGSGLWGAKKEVETLIGLTSPQDRVRRADLDREIVYGSTPVRGRL